jgi:hypothetical protein
MAEGRLHVCKVVVPKHRKTVLPVAAILAKIPTNKTPAVNAAVEAAVCAVAAVALKKVLLQARPPVQWHIHIIQHAARAIT